MMTNYLKFSNNLINEVIDSYDLQLTKHDQSEMGEWFAYFENNEFIIGITKDRCGLTYIELGSKKRIRPRAHMRGPWSMSHLKGYFDGLKDHYQFANITEEVSWLNNNSKKLFNSSFLNSDELNKWSVKASGRLYGKD